MYKVIIENGNTETLIHYPNADSTAPKILNTSLKERLSEPDDFSFSILPNNEGYNLLYELLTYVNIIDIRDYTVMFRGRVLSISDSMGSDGLTIRKVECESLSSCSYDTFTGFQIYNNTPVEDVIVNTLNAHNSKVDDKRKIYKGNILKTGNITKEVNSRSLKALIDIRDSLGGKYKLRYADKTYLDYIEDNIRVSNTVELGINMRDMIKEYDVTNIATRITPVNRDGVGIEGVNAGIPYVEDVSTYGVIEDFIEVDAVDPVAIKAKTEEILSKRKQPVLTLSANAIDLSTIREDIEQYQVGNIVPISNPALGVNAELKIVEKEMDIFKPYEPKLTLSNNPTRLSNQITSLETTKKKVDKVLSDKGNVVTNKLEGTINALKNQLVASGSYQNAAVIDGQGLLFENTNEQSSDYGALYIGPNLLAIASSKLDGKWNWRSFGTGNGFTADEITAGILRGITLTTMGLNPNGYVEINDATIRMFGENLDGSKYEILSFTHQGLGSYNYLQSKIGGLMIKDDVGMVNITTVYGGIPIVISRKTYLDSIEPGNELARKSDIPTNFVTDTELNSAMSNVNDVLSILEGRISVLEGK